MMLSLTVASSVPQRVQHIQKKLENKHAAVRKARKMSLTGIKKDLEIIRQKEVEYTKDLLKQIIPIEVEWDKDRVEEIKAQLPFRIKKYHFDSDSDSDGDDSASD